MLCAKLASVQKEQFVMDLCSAPGGKSLYVADQLKEAGECYQGILRNTRQI